jgi:hypothetical protein
LVWAVAIWLTLALSQRLPATMRVVFAVYVTHMDLVAGRDRRIRTDWHDHCDHKAGLKLSAVA